MSHEAHLCVYMIPLMNVVLIDKCIERNANGSKIHKDFPGTELCQVLEDKDVWHRSLP